MTEQKQVCLQSKPPNTGKSFGGYQSCHLVTSTLSHYCLCCLIAFILLCYGENHPTENDSSYNFREVQLQFQTSPQKLIIKQGFPARCAASAMPSGYLPQNTLSRQQTDEHPEKPWSWDPAKQLIELVTQKSSKRGVNARNFLKPPKNKKHIYTWKPNLKEEVINSQLYLDVLLWGFEIKNAIH